MAQTGVKTQGLKEFQRDMKKLSKELNKEINTSLAQAGKLVQDDARQRLAPINSYSAGGIRSRIRGFGRVTIEQTRKRTTGQRPDWGIKVMQRDLIPAVRENELQIIAILDRMLGRLGGEYF